MSDFTTRSWDSIRPDRFFTAFASGFADVESWSVAIHQSHCRWKVIRATGEDPKKCSIIKWWYYNHITSKTVWNVVYIILLCILNRELLYHKCTDHRFQACAVVSALSYIFKNIQNEQRKDCNLPKSNSTMKNVTSH